MKWLTACTLSVPGMQAVCHLKQLSAGLRYTIQGVMIVSRNSASLRYKIQGVIIVSRNSAGLRYTIQGVMIVLFRFIHTQRYKYIYKWCSLNLFE